MFQAPPGKLKLMKFTSSGAEFGVRVIWLPHLTPLWWIGLTPLISWLGGGVFPSSSQVQVHSSKATKGFEEDNLSQKYRQASTKSIGKLIESLVKWTHPTGGLENIFCNPFQQKTGTNNIKPKDNNNLYSPSSHSINIKHLPYAKHYSRY